MLAAFRFHSTGTCTGKGLRVLFSSAGAVGCSVWLPPCQVSAVGSNLRRRKTATQAIGEKPYVSDFNAQRALQTDKTSTSNGPNSDSALKQTGTVKKPLYTLVAFSCAFARTRVGKSGPQNPDLHLRFVIVRALVSEIRWIAIWRQGDRHVRGGKKLAPRAQLSWPRPCR